MFFQKIINLHATYRKLQSRLKKSAFYSPLGAFIDVGLLSENCHKINLIMGEDLLLEYRHP